MTPEERDIIGRFVARVGGAAAPSSFGGSVPATQQALPPVDPEADRFIADQFTSHPEARYRITQYAFVQETVLAQAQNRIKQLESALQQAQSQAQQAPQGGQGRGGIFSGLFGSGGQQSAPQYAPQAQYAPPPQQAYPPGYSQGMFGGGGSGFMGSALRTAAGVAGGVLAADAISSLFSHGGGYGGGFGGFGGGMGGGWGGGGEVVNETVVNNFGPQDAGGGADPWGGAGTSDPAASGGDAWSGSGGADDSWSGGGDTGGGDTGGDSGGGWDDNSGGGGDDTF
jgi:uncharacterized protein